ncbi:MAG: pyruvate kinase [Deltaproteobacteria bacterium]|jgi:pyruvate kinase|nr:pyruvate kinase [Deltaproteobacteria bacterium]
MKTKIIATVGPACSAPDKLRSLAEAGVSIFRLNFSHSGAASFEPIVRTIRSLEKELGIPLTIMQDLAGPKIRIGDLAEPLNIAFGDKVVLGKTPPVDKNALYIPFAKEEILASLEPGDRLALADGTLMLAVREKLPDGNFLLESGNSGIVTSRKGLALPGKDVRLPALTEKDKSDLRDGLALGVDAVALSYVQTPEDILEAKAIIAEAGKNIPVVAKLERQNAVDRLFDILKVVDVVMVARGDLGVECPLQKLPSMQKRIIKACNNVSVPVIVATQMLLSMVNNPSPTRAETTDVANAVLDGADCVMLSEETAMGHYPVETVQFMRSITSEAEALLMERTTRFELPGQDEASDFLSYSACLLAEKAGAVGLVAHSMSGAAARNLSARRPSQPIYILTPNKEVYHALNFSWGVRPHLIANTSTGHLERAESFIEFCEDFRSGDNLVITAGQPRPGEAPQGTNLVKIYRK